MSKTSDFNFNLPENLIANQPFFPKEQAKMMVFQDQKILDNQIKNLIDYLEKDDVIIFNDTKVIKSKLYGSRGEAKVEINLHKNLSKNIWQVFAKPGKRLKIGDRFFIAEDFYAQVLDKDEDGLIDLQFNCDGEEFFAQLEKYGKMPLPSYIKRAEADNDPIDEINYQTIYAKNSGAFAAPTAGLHFTEDLLLELEKKGVKKAFVTLNIGAGTFLPVKSEFIEDHKMHSEYFIINQEVCDLINDAKERGKRIIAVGTTSVRVLESAVDDNGKLKSKSGDTKIFIYPPHKFKIVDVLMTNFHLPKSTLFMLICAFIGKENALKLYDQAIKNNYRFYSYGDACLLHKYRDFE